MNVKVTQSQRLIIGQLRSSVEASIYAACALRDNSFTAIPHYDFTALPHYAFTALLLHLLFSILTSRETLAHVVYVQTLAYFSTLPLTPPAIAQL